MMSGIGYTTAVETSMHGADQRPSGPRGTRDHVTALREVPLGIYDIANGEHVRSGCGVRRPRERHVAATRLTARRTQDFGSLTRRRDLFDGTSKTAREDACAPRRVATINDHSLAHQPIFSCEDHSMSKCTTWLTWSFRSIYESSRTRYEGGSRAEVESHSSRKKSM